ncbi:unnamed protein product [Phaeothamnion confervicola]
MAARTAWRRVVSLITGKRPNSDKSYQRAADTGLAWLLTTHYRRCYEANCLLNLDAPGAPDPGALIEEVSKLSVDEQARAVQRNVNLQVVSCFAALERWHRNPEGLAAAERRIRTLEASAADRYEAGLPGAGAASRQSHVEAAEDAAARAMQDEFGFCMRVKPSTADGAGLGLFVDGTAPSGAVLGLFPGLVHLPEKLKDPDYYSRVVESDRDFMLLARYDWHVIDCRYAAKTPRSVWALAHMANHPPAGGSAAAMYVSYDIPLATGRGGGGADEEPEADAFPEALRRWVPNRYAVEPTLLGGKVDRSMLVDSATLIATRQVKDEEVFIDYRLNPDLADKLPTWYVPADPQAARRRWAEGADAEDDAAAASPSPSR